WLTRVMMALSQGCQNPGNWILALTGTLALVFMVRQRLRNDPRLAAQVFGGLCQVPVMGPMLVASSAARFSAATATLVSAGVRLDRCLKLGALASGNPVVVIDAPLLVDTIHQGERLSEYLAAREDVYPATLSYYVAVGEESSALSQMLFRAASFFDEELNYRIEALSAAIEPVLLGIVATIIGLVLLSVFLPLYGFLDKLGG
ncbi:MAG: type II secretion system F family protein, partial [Candidatus Eremiobacteraeota bacterium]|nr:type II secretion system F family protein [Candidatus Eremiobacteraeota bacterium]